MTRPAALALLADDATVASVACAAIARALGDGWLLWEPESLWLELHRQGVDIAANQNQETANRSKEEEEFKNLSPSEHLKKARDNLKKGYTAKHPVGEFAVAINHLDQIKKDSPEYKEAANRPSGTIGFDPDAATGGSDAASLRSRETQESISI